MRVLLGMSGGVDSTYTAQLLRQSGHEVEGAVLVMSDYTDTAAAAEACEDIGIKLHVIDARREFEDYVINNFIQEYSNARTPNPCVMCNRFVKVKLLCDYAKDYGFDKVATGHYCDIVYENSRYGVSQGDDIRKDQSYMLWQLTQDELSMLITPLAHLTKRETVSSAMDSGLRAAKRKESQEICFIPDNDYASFIENRAGKFEPGDFVDNDGNVLGRHKGIIHYTIGQRKGLGLAMKTPVFVTHIDPKANTVTVSPPGGEFADGFVCSSLNFQLTAPPPPEKKISGDFFVKVRYAAKPVQAHVTYDSHTAEVVFDEPQRAVTPGQSAVFYADGKVQFGGLIC